MRKIILASMAAAAFSLAACSEKAQQETSEAGDAIAAAYAKNEGFSPQLVIRDSTARARLPAAD